MAEGEESEEDDGGLVLGVKKKKLQSFYFQLIKHVKMLLNNIVAFNLSNPLYHRNDFLL